MNLSTFLIVLLHILISTSTIPQFSLFLPVSTSSVFVSCQRINSINEVRAFSKNPNDYINVLVKFRGDDDNAVYQEDNKDPPTGTTTEKLSSRFMEGVEEGIASNVGINLSSSLSSSSVTTTTSEKQHNSIHMDRVPVGVRNLLNQYSPSSLSVNQRETTEEDGTSSANVIHVTAHLQRTNVMAMSIQAEQLDQLLKEDGVEFVEYDHYMYPLQYRSEISVTGLDSIQAQSSSIIPNAIPSGSCFNVCIIDSGLFFHKDLPFERNSPKVHGREFNMPAGQRWDNPNYNHGTHVAGIMLAHGGNGFGIRGVLQNAPYTNNICLLVARVFDDAGNGQHDSVIASATEWCADNGAKVINLSLGSEGFRSDSLNSIFSSIRKNDKALIFAASGNSGTTEYNYPASYDGVVSVGAVGQDNKVAYYSVANDKVDIVAPGTNIISTVPVHMVYDATNNQYEMMLFEFSNPIPSSLKSSQIIGCGLAREKCKNASGKVCIIQRGSITFTEKAMNCQKGGGVAAIIYNDNEQLLPGTLSAPGYIKIPVVGVARTTGQLLKRTASVSFSGLESGYAPMSGTSMATPFVAGIAAKLWSVRPDCTADQIEDSILKTAYDLGESGSDVFYGRGLIQAEAAYKYLQKLPSPCGGFSIGGNVVPSDSSGNKNSKTVYTNKGNGVKVYVPNKNGNRRSLNLRSGANLEDDETMHEGWDNQNAVNSDTIERGALFPHNITFHDM